MRDNQTVIRRGLLALVPLFIACSGAPQQTAPVVGSIAGNAKFLDASAHAGIRVAVRGTDHVATTDASGAFLIETVDPGSYTLEASASGYLTATTTVEVDAGVRAQAALTLSREPATTGAISGRATRNGAATGNAGTAIAVLGTSWSASTADDGTFRIDGVSPGTYSLQFSAPGFTNFVVSSVTVTAGSTVPVETVALVRVQAGRVAGRVTRDGAATGNGGIAVFLEGTTALATTDDGGAFTLDGVMPGTYVLAASAPGFLFAEVPGVQVTDGVATQVAAVDLAPSVGGGSPVGDVQGVAGPLGASDSSGVSVALVASTGAILSATTTDGTGAFDFHAIPLGVYQVRFTLDGYDPVDLFNVLVLPGTYQMPPVVLYPGFSAGAATTGPSLALGSAKLLVPFAAGNAIYDWSTGTMTSTPLAGRLTILDVSSDAAHALVQSGQELVRLDLQTGAYTFLAAPALVYGRFAGKWVYLDEFGNVSLVGADDAAVSPAVSLGCTSITVFPFTSALASDTSPAANWLRFSGSVCRPYAGSVDILLDATTGRVSPPGDLLGVVDGGGAALILTSDAGSGRAVVRFDLVTGAVQSLRQNAVTFFQTSDYAPVWSNPDANGLGTISRLDLHDGTLVDLLGSAPRPSLQNAISVVQGGTPLSYNVIRFDRVTSAAICPAAGFNATLLPNYALCVSTQSPAIIRAYDLSNGALQTLSSGATNWFSPFGTSHVLAWQDAAGWHVARTDIAGAQVSSCDSAFSISQDESQLVSTCGQSYVVAKLLQGTTNTAFTAPPASAPSNPFLSAQGRFVIGQYTMPSSNGACGQRSCTVVVDTATGAQIQIGAPNPSFITNLSTAPGDSAVFFSHFLNSYAVVRPVAAGLEAFVQTSVGSSPSVIAWSRSGNCALINDATLVDTTTGAVTPGAPTALTFIGTSEAEVTGDTAADLSTCTVTNLGTGIGVLAHSASGITYIDPGSEELRSFAAGIGVTTLLTAVQPIDTSSGKFTGFIASGNSMYSVPSDGSVRVLVPFAPPLIQQVGQYSIAFANPDGDSGDAVLIDPTRQTALPLGARVPLTGGYFYGVNGNRFVFAGTLPGETVTRLLSANLDGTGTRIVGSGTVTGLAGSRLLFQSPDGIEWVEGATAPLAAGATAPLAIDRSFTLVGLSPDGSSMLIDGSASHPGLYRVSLP